MAITPSIAMIPSGYKASKIYSTLPTNGDADLDFSRSGVANRINSDGLIEEMSTNVPRLDYTDGSCPSLLLSPQRTNLITYSDDFSDSSWTINNANISSNQTISPDGTLNSDKIFEDESNTDHKTRQTIAYTANVFTWSIFAKASERNFIVLNVFDGTSLFGYTFDVLNGVLGNSVAGSGAVTGKIEAFKNGWYRCSITFTASLGSGQANFGTALNSTTTSYEGDGSSGLFVWGAQVEPNTSFSTSLINTSGASSTRSAESCSVGSLSNVLNSSEGTLFCEFKKFSNDLVKSSLTISDGSNSNRVIIAVGESSKIESFVIVSGVVAASFETSSYSVDDYNKIAIIWKFNNFKMFVNGVQIGSTDISGVSFNSNTLTEINLADGAGTSSFFYGKTKDLRVYNSALNNSEITTLTTL